jgi:hypothetical protein
MGRHFLGGRVEEWLISVWQSEVAHVLVVLVLVTWRDVYRFYPFIFCNRHCRARNTGLTCSYSLCPHPNYIQSAYRYFTPSQPHTFTPNCLSFNVSIFLYLAPMQEVKVPKPET